MLPSLLAQPTPTFTQRVCFFVSSSRSGRSSTASTASRFPLPFAAVMTLSVPLGARSSRAEGVAEQRPCPRQRRGITAGGDGTEVQVRPARPRGSPAPPSVHRAGRREVRRVAEVDRPEAGLVLRDVVLDRGEESLHVLRRR